MEMQFVQWFMIVAFDPSKANKSSYVLKNNSYLQNFSRLNFLKLRYHKHLQAVHVSTVILVIILQRKYIEKIEGLGTHCIIVTGFVKGTIRVNSGTFVKPKLAVSLLPKPSLQDLNKCQEVLFSSLVTQCRHSIKKANKTSFGSKRAIKVQFNIIWYLLDLFFCILTTF